MGRLGIIAGSGDLPKSLIDACQKKKIEYYLLAYEGHTDPSFVKGQPHDWVTLGEVGKTLQLLRDHKVDRLVMAGYFNRPSWKDIKPDLKGAKLLAKVVGKPFGDDGLFRVIVTFFEAEGFQVISVEDIIGQDVMISEGCLTRQAPDEKAWQDIERGFKVAKALGQLDVGQSVVVQQGLILGVEALEGSDALIERTKSLRQKGPGGVFVKVLKPGQESRVDRSVIGPKTVVSAVKAGLQGIAAQANHVILLEKEKTIALANENKIFLIGVKSDF